VALMSSGEFARASGLTRKALRLYDELGLLTPARVDPQSGYRYYAPAQLEQARLVAWLRRLGMPLASIRAIGALSPGAAATELAAYWERVELETASRRELASFLIGYLSGKDAEMASPASEELTVRYAVRSDIGLARADNEDAAYAGGEVASAAVISALRPLDTQVPSGELLNALGHAVQRAEGTLREMVAANPSLRGMGTTVTALLRSGSRIGLAHIGDTRAYLVRGGEVFQITRDHTVVQSLLDAGSITADEASSHPQRFLLLQALDGEHDSSPDLQFHDAVAGDRYLLSSDGLHACVPAEAIGAILVGVADPDEAAEELIRLAMESGGPDNVTCIVADVVAAVPDEAG
jgi:serine/threonine protein phosphatase PrpC/DNA-binding transcriptional MerR regulator